MQSILEVVTFAGLLVSPFILVAMAAVQLGV
jgi:hypothetical protein